MLGVTHSCIVPGKAINNIGFQLGDLRINTYFSKIWFLKEELLNLVEDFRKLKDESTYQELSQEFGGEGEELVAGVTDGQGPRCLKCGRNVTIHHLVRLTLTS